MYQRRADGSLGLLMQILESVTIARQILIQRLAGLALT